MCDECGSAVRGYRYRYYPPDSDMYERCVGYAWCTTCRVFTGDMVHIPRRRTLIDPLADLPAEQRKQLLGDEPSLIAYLDGLV